MVQASLSGTLGSLPIREQARRLLVIRVTLDTISPRPTDRPDEILRKSLGIGLPVVLSATWITEFAIGTKL